MVVGGVACGCKAAARARRLDPNTDITIVEQGNVLSYARWRTPQSQLLSYRKVSQRGYEAQRTLSNAGFTNVSFMEGGLSAWPYGQANGPRPD